MWRQGCSLQLKSKQPYGEGCIKENEKEFAQKLFNTKKETLEEELVLEKKHFEETGLFSNRDVEEIEDELKAVNYVLKNIDDLPKCSKT